MGRPLNKRFFGELGGADANIPVTFHDGNSVVEGYILNQKGTNKFTVRNPATSPVTDVVVRLTADGSTPNAAGEAMIEGYVTDRDTAAISIVKLFNRTVVGADGNRYTWELEDDSTSSVIILTAI